MTRADLLAWMAERNSAGVKTFTEVKPIIIGTLQVPADYDGTKQAQLEKELDKLRNKYGFSLARPYDPLEAAQNRYMKQVNDYIRKHARQFIKTLRQRKLDRAGLKLSDGEKKKAWPYAEDELEIGQDASWDRVKEVLDLTGNPDQFDRIRDEALRLYDVPEDVVASSTLSQDEAMQELRKATSK